jgi:uncharacterized protein YceH (UPF0502 family)
VLCVLLLRGPQTPGELRTRCERLYAFEDLDAVHAALNLLMRREPPMAKVLPRQPGTKESRYLHLLCGDAPPASAQAASGGPGAEITEMAEPAAQPLSSPDGERIKVLEEEVIELRRELETLRQQFASFQKQFQ